MQHSAPRATAVRNTPRSHRRRARAVTSGSSAGRELDLGGGRLGPFGVVVLAGFGGGSGARSSAARWVWAGVGGGHLARLGWSVLVAVTGRALGAPGGGCRCWGPRSRRCPALSFG